MRDLLSSFEGIELVTAGTAEQGIEEAARLKPDVIVMDINLPGMSGVEALRALRGLGDTRAIPVPLTGSRTEWHAPCTCDAHDTSPSL